MAAETPVGLTARIHRTRRAASLALMMAPVLLAGSVGQAQSGLEHDEVPKAGQPTVASGNWPCWRGPSRVGVRKVPLAVTQWSEDQGILWKTASESIRSGSEWS